MLKDLDITPDDPAELKAVNRLLADEVKALSLKIEQLQHQLHGANRNRFGSKSENLDQLNLSLAEDEAIGVAADPQNMPEPASVDAPPGQAKRQHSRKPLPDHLERKDTVLMPSEDCCRCGGKFKTLGEDVTEELEYVPGRFVVNRIVRPRLSCSCCERIVQLPLPSRPIERGRPGAGLLAHVLVSKYADHLPLYRQSQIFGREGIDLDRSTLADWVGRSTALLEPIADAIGRLVRQGEALFADDTPVKLQAPGTKKTKTARIWAYLAQEDRACTFGRLGEQIVSCLDLSQNPKFFLMYRNCQTLIEAIDSPVEIAAPSKPQLGISNRLPIKFSTHATMTEYAIVEVFP